MKSTIDAVIEFKAEWPCDDSTYMHFDSRKPHWHHCQASDMRAFYGAYRLICTIDQFSACIDELSTNFGTNCTYAEYKKQWENAVGIDWSEAPEGATHYDTSPDVHPWIKQGDKGNKFYYFNEWAAYNYNIADFDTIIAKPQPAKPIYTQSMVDEGVLPVAGMECLFTNRCDANTIYEKCTIEYIGDLYCVVILEDNRQGCSRIANYDFKPLTPPKTDTEKAIDDLRDMDESISNNNDWHKNFIDAIKNNEIHGVTFTGDKQ
ncbi:MAG: hypothetical protein COA43_14555 [Robiginitomaculum sp.]|nr:MAG: hypothetical protein COA43_14555 [Robiginitomaculum sp.]